MGEPLGSATSPRLRGWERLIHLGRVGYFADFVVYPLLLAALVGAAVAHTTEANLPRLILSLAAGGVFWTLLEYVAHRGVLHHVRPFRAMHEAHHAHPSSLVGTPTWMTAAAFVALTGMLWWSSGLLLATGLISGLAGGYLWYLTVHHAVHHWPIGPQSLLYPAKLRHARHHRRDAQGDYGVTTGFWDHVFHTDTGRNPAR